MDLVLIVGILVLSLFLALAGARGVLWLLLYYATAGTMTRQVPS